MDKFKKSIRESFRRKKHNPVEPTKPVEWQADEAAVKIGTCIFQVKYLGCTEVFESRGMQVCEEAFKILKRGKRKSVRAVLHVSGEALRVVDRDNKGLIVDQTIEKVSFCAPDRNYDRGFSYICRDGATRRWMCHGFMAAKYSKYGIIKIRSHVKGERLSHAVGCAFAACLDRKQARDKACAVAVKYEGKNKSSFTRFGSFAAGAAAIQCQNLPLSCYPTTTIPLMSSNSISQHEHDPNDSTAYSHSKYLENNDGADAAEYFRPSDPSGLGIAPLPFQPEPCEDKFHGVNNNFKRNLEGTTTSTRQRPKVKLELIRQASFRCPQLLVSPAKMSSSPFKKQLSLRLAELPSTLQRLNEVTYNYPTNSFDDKLLISNDRVPPAPNETFFFSREEDRDNAITNLCRQITQNFTDELTSLPNIADPSRLNSTQFTSYKPSSILNGYHHTDNSCLTYTTCSYGNINEQNMDFSDTIASTKVIATNATLHNRPIFSRNFGSVRLKDANFSNINNGMNSYHHPYHHPYQSSNSSFLPGYNSSMMETKESSAFNPNFKRSYSTRNPFLESHKLLPLNELPNDLSSAVASPSFNKTFVNLTKMPPLAIKNGGGGDRAQAFSSSSSSWRDFSRATSPTLKKAFTVDMSDSMFFNQNRNETNQNNCDQNGIPDGFVAAKLDQNHSSIKTNTTYIRQNISTNPFLSN